MSFLKRLKWVSAALAVAGVVTTAVVWGDPTRGRPIPSPTVSPAKLVSEDFGRFTQKPAVAYRTQSGDTYFAIQVKPELPATPVRPRDIQILVDCSASQAGGPLDAARKVAQEVLASANESDRISIWTVATPKTTRNLVRGGGLKPAAEAKTALTVLDQEFGSGAIDLKDTLERVAKEFDGKATRQQVILYLGDGESALNPLDEKSRYSLAESLRSQRIQFYAVPLGLPNNAHNLHTLVSGTGGAVLRPMDEKSIDPKAAVQALASRFHKSLGVSVLDSTEAKFAGQPAEFFPAKLPPLRADAPTLVVGRYAKDTAPATIELTVEGKVAGTAVSTRISHKLPEGGVENFFLPTMVSQWKNSGRIDSPAMLRADRTLALAFESARLAREEFLEQADWALGSRKVETAKSLYDAAAKLDPENFRAKAGLQLTDKLQKGEINFADMKKAMETAAKGDRLDVSKLLAQVEPKAPASAPKPAAPEVPAAADPNALLKQAEAQQRIREQQTGVAVEETLSRAKALLNSGDPKSAKDLLIAQRDSIRVNGDIREAIRSQLLSRIENLIANVVEKGDAIVRAQAEENERIARALARRTASDQTVAREEKIRERIKSFGTLMNQARYEDAYREALVMENEFVNEGRPVPIETQSVARIGQAAANYREFRELVRLREDRFLLSMMEVEKSHMPYPDEPAVHFPPAKIWRELTIRRRTFASTDFDRDLTPRKQQRYEMLQNSLLQSLSLNESRGLIENEISAGDLLKELQTLISNKMRQDVPIFVNWSTFKEGGDPAMLKEKKINLSLLKDSLDRPLPEVTFKTILELVTKQMGGSFWVTPDFLEIVAMDTAVTSKVFKVLPVEDLIIPIPNAVNQLSLQQQLQVLGQQFSLAGGNAFGQGGAFGGQVGGFVGGGGFNGQQGGGGQGNVQNLGQLFQGGGGALGFGGGNVGQFGNLGGQFGFQGGRQGVDLVNELVVLIQTVVDPGRWEPDALAGGRGAAVLLGQNLPADVAPADATDAAEKNRMMFNVSTRSMVIFGRSRQHRSSPSRPLTKDMAAGGANNPEGRAIVGAPPRPAPKAAGGQMLTQRANPATPAEAERIWRQAADRGLLDAGKVIACADFMAQAREFQNVVELLKVSLRKGITPERPYQEALALALEEVQGNPDEIERAKLSAIDLDPKDAQGYLTAASYLTETGRPDAALALCKVAAKLEPNVPDPYLQALVCADHPKATATYDVTSFAAGGLLARDWPFDGGAMHGKAREHLQVALKRLAAENKPADAQKVQSIVETDSRRDLSIELRWQGKADLDLKIVEPTGTVCSFRQPATTAGGSMKDQMDVNEGNEKFSVESYSASLGFSGKYKVMVDHVYGQPLGGKAQVKVTWHKGTPAEKIEYYTVDVRAGKEAALEIALADGHRTELAPLPSPMDQARFRGATGQSSQVMHKLWALTSGTRSGSSAMGGGVGSSTSSMMGSAAVGGMTRRLGDISWSTRLGAERSVGVDIRSETIIRADGKAEVKATPVFDGSQVNQVRIDLIPSKTE